MQEDTIEEAIEEVMEEVMDAVMEGIKRPPSDKVRLPSHIREFEFNFSGGSNERTHFAPPSRFPILWFWHTNFMKCSRGGSWRPLRGWAPYRESWIRHWFFWNFVVTIRWSHWYPLFRSSVDTAHGFQSQGGSIITRTLLLLVRNDPPQSQPWISRLKSVPILHLGMVRLQLKWPPNVTSGITGRGKIWAQDLAAQSPADALPTELSWPAIRHCI